MQLGDRGLETHNVAVPVLDIGERIARRGVARALQQLLRENLGLRAVVERELHLLLRRVGLDDLDLPLDALAAPRLVPRLNLLVIGHQVDELARERAVHVRPDPRLARPLVPLGELLVLGVHQLELLAHLRSAGAATTERRGVGRGIGKFLERERA